MKKKTKEKEPQYYVSATNMQTINYKVYYMSNKEKMVYSIIAFIVGAAIGYLFYGGLAKDGYGYATTLTYALNIIISGVVGLLAVKFFLPLRTEQLLAKRKKMLNSQFRDMLEGLTTSLSAGKNVMDSFLAVREDMKVQYEEGAFILQELDVIVAGMQNNINIEDLLADFGKRSGIDDIVSFADVFRVCYRKGGNIRDVIQNTRSILNDKLLIRDEIETTVTSSKTEQNLMIVMPVLLIGMIKAMSPEFAANFATPTGIMATTVAIVCFVVAYILGKKILDIKI
ncbi:MAG: type II secretion system F family protein [Roseburia sp.]